MLQTFTVLTLVKGTAMPIRMKVCNVRDYNEALKKRGMIFSLFEEAVDVWLERDVLKKDKCKNIYSDQLIKKLAVLRYLLKYPYRQLAGLLEEYLQAKNLTLPVPDFTTLCRRMAKMAIKIRDHRSDKQMKQRVKVIVDSSGINIYHTGGGHSKENSYYRQVNGRDQVRKMHIALDSKSKEVLNIKVTNGYIHDATVLPSLLEGVHQEIEAVYADGAYDRKEVRKACLKRGAQQVIPPWRKAVVKISRKDEPAGLWNERNAGIRLIKKHGNYEEGIKAWKEKVGYGKRSLVETFFSRFKAIFGFHFMSKSEKARENELTVKAQILNNYNQLGKAIFKRVA